MKQWNCDSLKNLPVPEELIAKAVAIPETVPRMPAALPWYRRTKLVASAASIVLVVMAGFTVFFLLGNKKPPVKDSTAVAQSTEIQKTTHRQTEPSKSTTSDGAEPSAAEATERAGIGATEPVGVSNPAGTTAYQTEIVQTAPSNAPDAANGEQPSENHTPATPPKATEHRQEKPTATDETAPHQVVTEGVTEKIVPVTEGPTEDPWEVSDPTEPPPPWMYDPSDPEYQRTLVFGMNAMLKDGVSYDHVYCRIYDKKNKVILGDPDPTAAQHKAKVTVSGNRVYISYYPWEHGITVPAGSYTITFNNENGKLLYDYPFSH